MRASVCHFFRKAGARLRQGHHHVEDGLLAAIGHDDLVQGVVQAGIAFEFLLDRLFQRFRAVLRRILGIPLQSGLMRRLDRV